MHGAAGEHGMASEGSVLSRVTLAAEVARTGLTRSTCFRSFELASPEPAARPRV